MVVLLPHRMCVEIQYSEQNKQKKRKHFDAKSTAKATEQTCLWAICYQRCANIISACSILDFLFSNATLKRDIETTSNQIQNNNKKPRKKPKKKCRWQQKIITLMCSIVCKQTKNSSTHSCSLASSFLHMCRIFQANHYWYHNML